jgi:beta-lactamase regulating signal transducer with metallopeptidase domain
MSELFLTVLNMSLMASYVILFVILVRLFLKKAPKFISYALWSVVAFRLIIPFSFESMFSLMPRNTNAVPIPHDIIYQQSPKINSGLEVVDSFVSQSLPVPTVGSSVNPLQIYVEIGANIWLLGIIALLVYSFVSILILKRQLKSAQLIENNIFEAKNLKTPFVLGFIKPKIYLPVGLKGEERSYILLHEQIHINRKDHIIKILAFFVLSTHWFNPLVWIAFMLMSTDMELSCDERVLKLMNADIKKPYANSLLSLAAGRHILNSSPLAFGEGNVKGRIKNVLKYKKPKLWVIIVSIIIVTVGGIGLMLNPEAKETDDIEQITDFAWEFINKDIANYESNPEVNIIDSKITRLELIETFDKLADAPIDVYALEYRLLPEDLGKVVLAGGMQVDEDGWLKETSSMGRPLLVILRYRDSAEFIGVAWTGEVGKLGLEPIVKSLLGSDDEENVGDNLGNNEISEEKVVQLVEEINPYQLEPTMSPKERYDLRTEIYSNIPEGKIGNFSHAIQSSAMQLYGIVSDNRYVELIDKENARWEAYENNILFGVTDVLTGVEGYVNYQPLLEDITVVKRLCNEGIKERNILKIIDANRILQDLSRHFIRVPYFGEGEEKVDYGDIHDLYFKATKTLEGVHNLLSD